MDKRNVCRCWEMIGLFLCIPCYGVIFAFLLCLPILICFVWLSVNCILFLFSFFFPFSDFLSFSVSFASIIRTLYTWIHCRAFLCHCTRSPFVPHMPRHSQSSQNFFQDTVGVHRIVCSFHYLFVHLFVFEQWRTQEFCPRGGGVSTNSVEDRGQRERGSGGGSPLVRGSGGSCNLVQEISFHMVKFS